MSASIQPHNLSHLPPEIDLKDQELLELVIKARSELGELKGYSYSMPNPMLLLSPAIIKESLASSEIENINTTIINVLENQLFPEIEQKQPDKEVLRYRDAIIEGFSNLSNVSLSTRLILRIQKTLLPETKGEYRNLQNGIENTATKEIIYVPPIAARIPDYMNNLEKFMNNEMLETVDPLIKCAISHYQFEAIHPFNDGNGRTGRILMVLNLIHADILTLPILYISGYINKNKSEYYRLLLEVTKKNNWKEYLQFMLKGFYLQAQATKKLLFAIMNLYREYRRSIKEKHRKIYSADLVEALFTYPIITPNKLAQEMGIHYTTATRYLEELRKASYLEEKKLGRYHFYINSKLLDILHS